jgi:hypothetical protein
MKLHDILLFEGISNIPIQKTNQFTEDSRLKELWTSLLEMLKKSQAELSKKVGPQSSHSLGGNVSAVISGKVELVKNYVEHSHGSQIKWDYALQVGNGIQGGKALEEVKALYKNMLLEAQGYELKKLDQYDGVFHANFNDATVSCTYEYARSFCWIAIRKK